MAARFNPPPNWPPAPEGWNPPPGWTPDPSWGPPPPGWPLWIEGTQVPTALPMPQQAVSGPLTKPVGPTTALPRVAPGGGSPVPTSWLARHKVLVGVGAVVVVLAIIGVVNGSADGREEPAAAPSATQASRDDDGRIAEEAAAEQEAEAEAEAERQAEEEAQAAAEAEEERLAEEQRAAEEAAAAEAAAAEAARIGTVAQQNAYRSAVNYLELMAFSRSGIIGQLTFEGYTAADAEFAIARLEAEGGVDWNAQAAAKAADYLAMMAFSRSGLIDQLLFEGFTAPQAEYGVSTTGL